MAARAATIAYEKASDPDFCPELTTREHLAPFQPLKLYYYNRESPTTVEIPSGDFSRALNMRYADIRASGMSKYRSQGFDQFLKIPVDETRSERFMLVRSEVPTLTPETHLLEGALLSSGSSPPGVRLHVEPEAFEVGVGGDLSVRVTLVNGTSAPMNNVCLTLAPERGWTVRSVEDVEFSSVEPDERVSTTFIVNPGVGVDFDRNARLTAGYDASSLGRVIKGNNATWLRATAPVRVRFEPLYDVAGYRTFAEQTRTEWVIESLPARLPLTIGRTNALHVQVTNTSGEIARGSLSFEAPAGIEAERDFDFEVAAGDSVRVPVTFRVDESVLPPGRHSAKVPIRVSATVNGLTSVDAGDVYALPSLDIPRVSEPPRIDGDLSDMEGLAKGEISPKDLWWRREPESAADESGTFYLGYDSDYLYIGAVVRDDAVVCNIAPDDVRAQLRSDAIGITIDPSGRSRDTSTVIQAAAFPCTTEAFVARGFRDADANQGPMEETAPGMQVASRRTDVGYTFEARIPWSAGPERPDPGDEIGLNIILYDGDLREARVGANISESGLGWAAFPWGGKQALPYLWPRVRLSP